MIKKNIDISIIIVNYKSKDLTLNCIKSIKAAQFIINEKRLKYEIIVIDNNSEDGIGKIISKYDVIFIQNIKNIGMGKANNIGFKIAKGKFIVVINPDILVNKDTFTKLYEFMEENINVGIVGPKQLSKDNKIQNTCFRNYKLLTPIFRRTFIGKFKFAKKDIQRFLMDDFNKKIIKEVQWVMGSFLFIRKRALKSVGFFDKRFFLYFEDTDLCRRFWKNNWKVVYFPKTKIIHYHKRESAKNPLYKFFLSKTLKYHIASWYKYFIKWGI